MQQVRKFTTKGGSRKQVKSLEKPGGTLKHFLKKELLVEGNNFQIILKLNWVTALSYLYESL